MIRKNAWNVLALMLVMVCAFSFNTARASVALGATRVIYPADAKQVSIGVSNNDDKSTYLIQSWIENERGEKGNQFVITPPLFLIKGKKENTLRIIDSTNNSLAKDKETLFWLNVKAIPSADENTKDKNVLQFAIISRIKLIYRPAGLAMAPEKASSALTFRRSGSTVTVSNPTPYYITTTNVTVGKKAVKSFMVQPGGSIEMRSPAAEGNAVSYQTINDFGALTTPVHVAIN